MRAQPSNSDFRVNIRSVRDRTRDDAQSTVEPQVREALGQGEASLGS